MSFATKKETVSGEATYKFKNDPNTGVHSPAADVVSLIAGGVSILAAQLSGSVDILKIMSVGTLAAAGSAQGDGGAIVDVVTAVSAADGTKGVTLPTPVAGQVHIVYSSVATNGLKVYPHSGGDINDGTQDAAITIEGKSCALFVAVDTTTWAAIYTVNT